MKSNLKGYQVDEIINELVAKYNVDIETITKLVDDTLKGVVDELKKGEAETILVTHIGKFTRVKDRRNGGN